MSQVVRVLLIGRAAPGRVQGRDWLYSISGVFSTHPPHLGWADLSGFASTEKRPPNQQKSATKRGKTDALCYPGPTRWRPGSDGPGQAEEDARVIEPKMLAVHARATETAGLGAAGGGSARPKKARHRARASDGHWVIRRPFAETKGRRCWLFHIVQLARGGGKPRDQRAEGMKRVKSQGQSTKKGKSARSRSSCREVPPATEAEP